MKIFNLLSVLALALSATAQAQDFDSQFTKTLVEANGECFDASKAQLLVTRDLGDSIYETVTKVGGKEVARGAVKISLPVKVGSLLSGVKLHYRGVQEATLVGGTSAKFGLWEQCK